MAATALPSWEDVLQFWFGGSMQDNYRQKWFPSATERDVADKLVKEKFGALLAAAETGCLNVWAKLPRSMVALIIVLDQFSRHVYRDDRPSIDRNDKVALALAEEVLEKGWDNAGFLALPEQIFALMPLRHSATVERLNRVLASLDASTLALEEQLELASKFRRTTLRNLQDLQGKGWDGESDILERHAFEADETGMEKLKIYKVFEAFLRARKVKAGDVVAVSLSGGVDSMVAAKLLVKLSPVFGGFTVLAMHIDYGNRPESGAEAAYVEKWCADLGIVFRKRTITEAKRGVTKRDDYEKLTRDIRYGFYKDVREELPFGGVIFGHHQGDLQENVISNVMKQASLLYLGGMAPVSVVNQVTIWRPMLELVKDDIYDFAHTYGVPYFLDTTPKWSTRGKMRNQLQPLLQEMYGEGYLRNLSHLAAESEELRDLTHMNLFQPFYDSCKSSNVAVWFPLERFYAQPAMFWREALKHVSHTMLGSGLVKATAVDQMLSRLARRSEGWMPLKRDNRTLMKEDTIFIFRAEFFPPAPHARPRDPVAVGGTTVFGPWKVTATLEDANGRSVEGQAGFTTADIAAGEFEYLVPACNQLMVWHTDRPAVFRQVDKKLSDALPLAVPALDEKHRMIPPTGDAAEGEKVVRVRIVGDMWSERLAARAALMATP